MFRLVVALALLSACGNDVSVTKRDVDADGDGYLEDVDCDDVHATVHPDADELCNEVDDDCDGAVDEDAIDPETWFVDGDGDGFGDAADGGCTPPDTGIAVVDGDCDDDASAVFPGAEELCNSLDDDCDGDVDEDAVDATIWYDDADADGYGGVTEALGCAAEEGQVAVSGDCDDGAASVHPGAPEADCADPTDYNCDGSVGYADLDGDTVPACQECDDGDATVYPGAAEDCDGVDDDCDAAIDDGVTTPYYADDDADGFGDAAVVVDACASPSGYVADDTDCDDGAGDVYPGAAETCDGVDQDCDGTVDNRATDAGTWYADTDGDGFGDASTTVSACDAPAGYVPTASDCDDGDASVHPGADEGCDGVDEDCDGTVDEAATDAGTWYADIDGDGFGDASSAAVACDAPASYVADDTDCEDRDSGVHPGATEVCDGVDQDCDGTVDEDASDAPMWYADDDADGHGADTSVVAACDAPAGFVASDDDCDDTEADVYPDAPEWCDGVDHDCDGAVDEASSVDTSSWYADLDGDGFGDGAPATSCDAPLGYVASATDCDDGDAGVNPDATEVCDALNTDEDCDGRADDLDTAAGRTTWYRDADTDGYGGTSVLTRCDAPSGYVSTSTDCNDGSAAINPAATEVCDSADTDEDCDGSADDLDSAASGKTRFYADTDADTYGVSTTYVSACNLPSGYVVSATDCDDGDATVNPGATEVCDSANTDEDCDGVADDLDSAMGGTTWYRDADSDTYGGTATTTACDQPSGYVATSTDCEDAIAAINPGATEVCDSANTDEDCDGLADDLDSATGRSTWYRDVDSDTYGGTTTTSACDQPSGYVATSTDCNDAIAAINPAATEVCDASNTDEDCDGLADDLDTATGRTTWYRDVDSDTYGGSTTSSACDQPGGYVATSTDCDDAIAAINPAATEVCDTSNTDEDCDGLADDLDTATGRTTWYRDGDSDTYGGSSTSSACDQPSGYVATSTDCNDANAAINPAATEVCDASDTDEDCDGVADDLTATGRTTWYRDGDGDIFGGSTSTSTCEQPIGYVATSTDCDDTRAAINPGALEACDSANTDEDCDGLADDLDTYATGESTWYSDADSDSFGGATTSSACDQPGGYVATSTDCDDARDTVSPAATETCSTSYDDDCDGSSNEAGAAGCIAYHLDADGDGYGVLASSTCLCAASGDYDVSGVTSANDDCDDTSAGISPADTEVCDSLDADEDCDGAADDADTAATGKSTVYADADGDGYGASVGAAYCDPPSGTTSTSTDCDDAEATVNPAAAEVCGNGTDDDCDGSADGGCPLYTGDYAAEVASTDTSDADAVIYGEASADFFGEQLVTDLDFDNDGYSNFAVAASGNNYLSSYYGSIYAYDGFPTGTVDADTNDVARVFGGGTTNATIPDNIWKVEDFDSDGKDEFAAQYTILGNTYVYFSEGEDLVTTASFGTTTYYFAYVTYTGPVSGLGDENSTSGNNEVGVSDWDASSNQGAVYICIKGGSSVSPIATINGEDPGDYAGWGLAGGDGNDPNGDGYDDIFIGAHGDDTSGANAGAAYVVEAPVTGTFDLSSAQVKITGGSAGDSFGYAVQAPGDFNGDGREDLLVTAPYDDDGGTDAGVIFVFEGVNTDGSVKDNDSTDFEVKVIGANASDTIGYQPPAVGDVDGDGELDLLVGSPEWDNGSATNAGAAWLIYGPLSGTYDLDSSSDYDARFLGNSTNDACGASVGLGDLDADGADEILMGCTYGDVGTYSGYGAVYIFGGG